MCLFVQEIGIDYFKQILLLPLSLNQSNEPIIRPLLGKLSSMVLVLCLIRDEMFHREKSIGQQVSGFQLLHGLFELTSVKFV